MGVANEGGIGEGEVVERPEGGKEGEGWESVTGEGKRSKPQGIATSSVGDADHTFSASGTAEDTPATVWIAFSQEELLSDVPPTRQRGGGSLHHVVSPAPIVPDCLHSSLFRYRLSAPSRRWCGILFSLLPFQSRTAEEASHLRGVPRRKQHA